VKQSIKDEWLAALRSGKYEQGRYRLRTENQYCCLGVLCDILKEKVDGEWVRCVEPPLGNSENTLEGCDHQLDNGQEQWCFRIGKQETTTGGALPKEVAKHVGLPTDNLTIMFLPHFSLSDLNDSGASFEKIAEAIEKNL